MCKFPKKLFAFRLTKDIIEFNNYCLEIPNIYSQTISFKNVTETVFEKFFYALGR